jgi:hypothetical protein
VDPIRHSRSGALDDVEVHGLRASRVRPPAVGLDVTLVADVTFSLFKSGYEAVATKRGRGLFLPWCVRSGARGSADKADGTGHCLKSPCFAKGENWDY